MNQLSEQGTQAISLEHTAKESAGGYEICVRRNSYDAAKKTIVMIHGIGVSSAYFVPLCRALSPYYNVLALDLPGYGKAAKPNRPLTIEELANVTHAFLQQHNFGAVTLIGHSMGCQIVAYLGRAHPASIEKLILLAPTVYRRERSLVMQSLRLLQDSFHESFKTNCVIYSDYARMGPLRYLRTAKWMVADRIENNLQGITIPALLVRGGNDRIVPHTWLSHLSTLSQMITTAEVPHMPHALHHKDAKRLVPLCRKFIGQ